MLDVETVAAGGGSILFFDGLRARVGPHSAGANPGPAAYGRGGPATVTDATLVLGDPCRVAVDTVHEGLGDHAFGAVSVHVPAKLFGSAARLQSLDEPPHRVPRDLRVDEAGNLFVAGLLAGRYRLTLLGVGPPVSVEFDLGPGEEKAVQLPAS